MKYVYPNILLFLLVLPLMAFTGTHKFYVSVTQIAYAEREEALQITTRIFVDDLELLLNQRYGYTSGLATEKETEDANALIEKYLRAKLLITLDGKKLDFDYLGRRYDNDVVICYLEITDIQLPEKGSLAVSNEILTDVFEEQQNVVHIKIGDEKKSFVLTRSDAKGVLNL